MPKVVHFEIPADNPERANKFYADIFGWEISKMPGPEDYWMLKTGPQDDPGIGGGLMKRQDPSGSTTIVIDVPAVDDYVKKITDAGCEIVVAKMAIPGIGYVAYFKDTEGNVVGIYQDDSKAS